MSSGIVFGPVPSRRLGRSLGVNNIPYKHCSYSCVYCQVGRTLRFSMERRVYYPLDMVVNSVLESVKKVSIENIDYVTFVPDGEPTLDINLGKEILGIKNEVPVKVSVITNGSLLYMNDVRGDLYNADLVSIKVDAYSEDVFKKVNRPHPNLIFDRILEGIKAFAKEYKGELITETMLVKGLNNDLDEIKNVARFIRALNPKAAYIAVPTRPPAEKWVKPADESSVLTAYKIFQKYIGEKSELLISYEGSEFEEATGDPIYGLLSIISVHPMRIDYAIELLEKKGLDPIKTLENLLRDGKIIKVTYRDKEFIMRKWKK
ncbi:MAG: radical SAM protein [Candidatus Njordarchaeia archaeon]